MYMPWCTFERQMANLGSLSLLPPCGPRDQA